MRKRLVVMLVLMIGGAGVQPATAATGLYRAQSPTDPPGSAATRTVTATCTVPGTRVYGTGGEVIGGNGQVALISLSPNTALTSVTVRAAERTAFTGNWSLRAYAICGDPVAGLHLESVSGGFSATETCDGTTKLYGTGAVLNTGHPRRTLHQMTSAPGIAPTTVTVTANPPDTPPQPTVTAHAICGAPSPGQQAVEGQQSMGSSYVSCPSGTRVHGTGARVVDGTGDSLIEAIVPDPGLQRVTVSGRWAPLAIQGHGVIYVASAVCAEPLGVS